jgi:hypothetical protein
MTAFLVFSFLAYSAFCWWVVFWDGAEILEGWKAAVLFDWTAITLTASELRFGMVISWIVALVLGLVGYYS